MQKYVGLTAKLYRHCDLATWIYASLSEARKCSAVCWCYGRYKNAWVFTKHTECVRLEAADSVGTFWNRKRRYHIIPDYSIENIHKIYPVMHLFLIVCRYKEKYR